MTTDAHADALLEALFAHAPVGLALWDGELRYRRVNAALAAMNGIAPADHYGRTPSELLPGLGEEIEATLRAVLAEDAPRVDLELTGRTPARPGEEHSWRASYYPVPSAEGDISGVAAVVVETADELAARREQERTSALLDAVFGAAPVGIAFLDTDLRYRRVNEALAVINRVSAEEHLGRRPSEVLGELGVALEGLLGEVAQLGEPVIDVELEMPVGEHERQFRHTTLFPVRDAQGGLAGFAGVVRDVTAAHRDAEERDRLLREALAARAAAEAAQVRAETAQAAAEAARRRTELLVRTGHRLSVLTRDYERTLQEVASVVVPEMADFCAFALVGPRGAPRTVALAAADPAREIEAIEMSERYPIRLDAPAGAGRVLRTGEAELIRDVDDEMLLAAARDREHLAQLRALGLRSGIVVPLQVRNRTIGTLSVAYAESGRRYDEDDVQLMRSLAVRAALAVENARLYTERSHIAQTLQRSLLPPALPDVTGLELAARYRAAGEQNEVGGDFYDAFRAREDGVWTVLIGDVAGKGAEAAALTSLTRHTLRASALRTIDPIENLQLLNEALWAQGDVAGRFCTVLYAQVRPDAHGAEVTLATGGHLPPVVLRAGGRVERIQVRGAIVGGLREPVFGERKVRLDHGDLLLMFTDGVVELRTRTAGVTVSGDVALEEVLREHRGAPADEIVAAVEHRAVQLQGGEPRDDIALVALRPEP